MTLSLAGMSVLSAAAVTSAACATMETMMMTGMSSTKPGSITEAQRGYLADYFIENGIGSRQRGYYLLGILGDSWAHGGDLGWLSQADAELVRRAIETSDVEPGTLTAEPAEEAP